MREIERVLAPGGYAHLVTPFCHPFHEYPEDFRRFTPDGLRLLAGSLQVVAEAGEPGPPRPCWCSPWKYAKLLLPWRWWRVLAHGAFRVVAFPFPVPRSGLFRSARLGRIGNHCYIWLRKEPAP